MVLPVEHGRPLTKFKAEVTLANLKISSRLDLWH